MAKAAHPNEVQLRDYLLGKLPPEKLDRIASHLEACPNCEQTVASLDRVADTLVSQVAAPTPPASEADDTRMRAALQFILELDRQPATVDGAPAGAGLGQLGAYRLLAKLGQGGMGAVYKALHVKLEKVVALKVLAPGKTTTPQAIARFEREMKAVGKLDHPHIVRAHDAGEADGVHFLVMEHVAGTDLGTLAKDRGPLPVAEACELVRQAALGLQCAHEHGLVHRDIKPSNIMLARGGEVKVLDLGLALLADRQEAAELTSTGQVMGTIDYMAPEQAHSSHEVDIRADVYALGATLYKLLAGQAPFAGEKFDSLVKKLMALANEPHKPLCEIRADVPVELSRLVDRLLAKKPSDRPATPQEVADELAPFSARADVAALLGEGSRPGAASPRTSVRSVATSRSAAHLARTAPRPSANRTPPWHRRPLFVAGALGGAAALLLGVILIVRDQDGKEKARLNLNAGDRLEIQDDGPPKSSTPDKSGGDKSSAKPSPPKEANALALAADPPKPAEPAAKSPYDQLDRSQIDPYELAVAGSGDAERAPKELVAIFGDSRLRMAGQACGVSFNVDGTLVASGLGFPDDNCLRIWETKSGKQVRVIETPVRDWSPQFDPQGELIFLAHRDGELKAFRVDNGEPATPAFGRRTTGWFQISRDGEVAALLNGEGKLSAWKRNAKEPLVELKATPTPWAAALHPDGGSAMFLRDNQIRRIDLKTKEETDFAETAKDAGLLVFSHDGKLLAARDAEGVKVWDVTERKLRDKFERIFGTYHMAFSRDDRRLAICGQVAGVQWWDLESGESLPGFGQHPHSTERVMFSPDGRTIATTGWGDALLRLWDFDGNQLIKPATTEGILSGLRLTDGGATIATWGGFGSKLNLRSVADGRLRSGDDTHPWMGVARSPDGALLAQQGQDDKTIRLYGGASGGLRRTFTAPFKTWGCALSPGGKYLAAGYDQTVVWDLASGRSVTLPLQAEHVAFTADGTRLVGTRENRLSVWNLAAGKIEHENSLAESVDGFVMLPDSKRIVAIAPLTGRLRIFDLASGEMLTELGIGHVVAVSPDGTLVAGASGSKLRVWNAETGYLAHEIDMGVGQHASGMEFAPDSRHLVVSHGTGTVYVLRFDAKK